MVKLAKKTQIRRDITHRIGRTNGSLKKLPIWTSISVLQPVIMVKIELAQYHMPTLLDFWAVLGFQDYMNVYSKIHECNEADSSGKKRLTFAQN